MKRLFLLLLITISSFSANADHISGGEITWTCLPNGDFIFSMVVYRDCIGLSFLYQNETINIVGAPFPTNGVTSIVVKPDSLRWRNSNFGDTSPKCTSNYGTPITCSGASNGTVQAFYYTSDPVTLTGTPPSTGWKFFWQAVCCRSIQIANVNTNSGVMLLKSTMYPSATGTLVNTCFDSSPQFVDLPQVTFCRSSLHHLKFLVEDQDGDSISYAFGSPINIPIASPQMLIYKPGYSQTNPMPDQSFDPLNIPATLNPMTGDLSFAVFNSMGTEKYVQLVEVTAWKYGVKTATIAREIIFSIIDCPLLPSGDTNAPPFMTPPFSNGGVPSFSTTVVAGTNLSIPIFISDTNTTGVGSGLQEITVSPNSTSLSLDFVTPTNCLNPLDTSCAVFSFTPALDTNQNPARFAYKGQGAAILFLSWQTDCNHLSPSGNAKTHYFTFKVSDDHCPIPSIIYKTVEITVIPSTSNCNLITRIQESSALTLKDRVQLFPNPTKGDFSIQFANQLEEEVEIMVRDIRGKLIEQKQYTAQSRMDLSIDGSLGIYFVQITNAFGEQLNLKVIKQ